MLLLSLIVNGGLVLLLLRPASSSLQIVPPSPTPQDRELRVSVAGAVARPDVYRLRAGSLVQDALRAAGGATAEADLSQLNLAREVRDQEQIWVPSAAQPGTTPSPAPDQAGRLNLNAATTSELETLPGIGPELARRIVAFRDQEGPFGSPDELRNVPGIGDATMLRLKDLVAALDTAE